MATLACTSSAEAVPICRNVSAVLAYTATYPFNPANQLVAPFNIAQSFHTFSSLTNTGWNGGFFTRNLPGAEVALSSKGLVADLVSGARIGPGGRFGKGAFYGLIFTYNPISGATSQHHLGNLRFGQTNYLGFRFRISGKAHYGWLRLESTVVKEHRGNYSPEPNGPSPSIRTEIMAYGYESTPDTAILAGSCAEIRQSTVPDSVPASDRGMGELTEEHTAASSLGLLALGAQGLPLWSRKERVYYETQGSPA